MFKFRVWEMKQKCPEGPTECTCLHDPTQTVEGPFEDITPSFRNVHNYIICNPGFCKCPGRTEMVDVRPPPVAVMEDLCRDQGTKINRCLCENKKDKLKGDYTMFGVFDCKPTRCKCEGSNQVHVNDGLGCDNGGFPTCDTIFDEYCSDGTQMTPTAVMEFKMNNGTGCFCSDGMVPKCKATGDYARCPDGNLPNLDLRKDIVPEIKNCKFA